MTTTTTKQSAMGSVTTLLTTELNTQAFNASVLSGMIDNAAGELFLNLELYLAAQGSARTAGGYVRIDFCGSVDGTNAGDATAPIPRQLVQFNLDAATTARYCTQFNLRIPPCKFKLNITNVTGQAFAASGNTLKYTLHSLSTA